MPIAQAVSMLYLFILTSVMPPGIDTQYRITITRGTESEVVYVDKTDTGFDFSDGSGVLMARAIKQPGMVYAATYGNGSDSVSETVELKSYVPTLAAPFVAPQNTATYPTSDGGTLTLTRKGYKIVLQLSSMADVAVTIEPRGL